MKKPVGKYTDPMIVKIGFFFFFFFFFVSSKKKIQSTRRSCEWRGEKAHNLYLLLFFSPLEKKTPTHPVFFFWEETLRTFFLIFFSFQGKRRGRERRRFFLSVFFFSIFGKNNKRGGGKLSQQKLFPPGPHPLRYSFPLPPSARCPPARRGPRSVFSFFFPLLFFL